MNKTKLIKIAKGAAIAAAGAILAYMSGTVIPQLEVAGTSAAIVAVFGAIVNIGKVILQKVEE